MSHTNLVRSWWNTSLTTCLVNQGHYCWIEWVSTLLCWATTNDQLSITEFVPKAIGIHCTTESSILASGRSHSLSPDWLLVHVDMVLDKYPSFCSQQCRGCIELQLAPLSVNWTLVGIPLWRWVLYCFYNIKGIISTITTFFVAIEETYLLDQSV